MQRSDVESSQIKAIGYDEKTETCEIEFKGKAKNSLYQYFKFDSETHARFMAAESKGTFLGQWIKGKFEFKKVGFVVYGTDGAITETYSVAA